jgi:DNA-binding beta-propeller fold protein YncE
MQWGKPGSGPGEFNTLHSIAVDSKQRVYVADRGNSRIQIFDENGKFLDQWTNIRSPNFIHISKDNFVWICDGVSNKILKYDTNGKLLYSWGTYGDYPGAMWSPHQFSVDSEGNLYVAEAYGGRAQKFRPKPGADPAHLVHQ